MSAKSNAAAKRYDTDFVDAIVERLTPAVVERVAEAISAKLLVGQSPGGPLIDRNEFQRMLGISATTFWRLERIDEDFPRTIVTGHGVLKRYLRSDVERYIDTRHKAPRPVMPQRPKKPDEVATYAVRRSLEAKAKAAAAKAKAEARAKG